MKKKPSFAVIGGDKRQIFAAKRLRELGYTAELFALTEGRPYAALKEIRADAYLLPIPFTRDGETLFAPESDEKILISELFSDAPRDALLFAGRTQGFSDERLTDYGEREDFALYNAVPTAEGALLLAMQNLGRTVNGTRVAVIGFGKVARAAARLFHALGACVTVFARRAEARAEAQTLGYRARDIAALPETAGAYALFLNTVPARLLNLAVLSAMRGDALIMELASAPYGVDLEEAKALGLRVISAGGLPGKYFPETAGITIADTVINMIEKG